MRSVPVGVQPQHNGLLICLLCHKGFKGLAHHVKHAHGVTADEYKEQFELPKRGLLSEATLEKRRAHARHLLATDERVRNGILRQDPIRQGEFLAQARVAAAQASRKAGVRQILRFNGQHAARVSAQARRDAHQRRAQELGFAGVADLVAQTVDLSNPELGKLLGCSGSNASKLRREHGAPSQHMRHKRKRTQQARRMAKHREFEAALAPRDDIVRPRDSDGRWRCQCCGRYVDDLNSHVQRVHHMKPHTYLRRLEIRQRLEQKVRSAGHRDLAQMLTDTALLSRDEVASVLGVSRRHLANLHSYFPDLPTPSRHQAARSRSAAASRAQRGKRQRARDEYDQKARLCGYVNISELIAATTALTYKQLGALLGVPAHRIQFVRSRYGGVRQSR